MIMTYREPQPPLFPLYVNLLHAKDKPEHNTNCAVRITNSYDPNICIYPPMFYTSRQLNLHSQIIRSSAGMSLPCTEQLLFYYAQVNTVFHSMALLNIQIFFPFSIALQKQQKVPAHAIFDITEQLSRSTCAFVLKV